MRDILCLSVAFASLAADRAYAAADNFLGIDDASLRNGDVSFDTVPNLIRNVTTYLLGIVGSVCVVMIIYGAVRMGLGSLSNDKETGKKIVSASLIGLVVSLSGWFLVNLVISNL